MPVWIKDMYNAGALIWNAFIDIAMQLFKADPSKVANGSPYAIVHNLYNSICDATVPLATCFFIIAIYKDVVSSPPEQQAVQFLKDALRYVIILFISTKMWNILKLIIKFSSGIIAAIGGSTSAKMTIDNKYFSELSKAVTDAGPKNVDFANHPFKSIGNIVEGLPGWVAAQGLVFIAALIFILIVTACCFQLIMAAFSRVIKPLLIMPFAGIALSTGAGDRDISRSLSQFIRTFFGFLISGALMVICVLVSKTLCDSFIKIDYSSVAPLVKVVLMTVQMSSIPIITVGLVKASDEVVKQIF